MANIDTDATASLPTGTNRYWSTMPPDQYPYYVSMADPVIVTLLSTSTYGVQFVRLTMPHCHYCKLNKITMLATKLVNGFPLCRWHDVRICDLPRISVNEGRVRVTTVINPSATSATKEEDRRPRGSRRNPPMEGLTRNQRKQLETL